MHILLISLGALALLLVILVAWYLISMQTQALPAPVQTPAAPKFPRNMNIKDGGYTYAGNIGDARGWYDALGQGVCNDFCRYVGDSKNPTFSCALSSDPNNEYTSMNVNAAGKKCSSGFY